MAAVLRLCCEVVASSLSSGCRIGRVSDNVTRCSDRGGCTLASYFSGLQQESSVRSLGCFSSVDAPRWQGGQIANGFPEFDFGFLAEKKWKQRPRKLGLPGVHTTDARCQPDELLHSRECSLGMQTMKGDSDEECNSNLASSSGIAGAVLWNDFVHIQDGESLDNNSATRQATQNEPKGIDGSSCWWSFGDCIHEVLHLPNGFEQQIEMLHEKLGCRLTSRELLLRVLVHRSYYEANMPMEIRDRRIVIGGEGSDPSSGSRTSTEVVCELSSSECHRQARSNLALVGDALLSLVTSQSLILEHPFQPTGGEVTQRRSQLVCNSNLRRVWSSLGLDDLPLTHLSVSMRKGRDAQSNVHADTFEALIGALVCEKGLKFAEAFVTTHVLPLLRVADKARNPVVLLQEQSLITLQITPEYRLIGVDNKDTPSQLFRVRVYVKGLRMATGLGPSSKSAKKDAADKAMRKWSECFEQLSKL